MAAADAAFDEAQGWAVGGHVSLSQWLRTTTGVTRRQAARQGTLAARLASWPTLREAWVSGAVSGGQVEAVVAGVPARLAGRFAEGEAELVPALAPLDVADTAAVVREWVRHAEALDETTPDRGPERRLHASRTLGGVGVLDAVLDPDGYTVVETALRVARRDDVTEDGEVRTLAERNADALVDLSRFFLDHVDVVGRPGRQRPHLEIAFDVVDLYGAAVAGHGLDHLSLEEFLAEHPLSPGEATFARSGADLLRPSATTIDGVPMRTLVADALSCDAVVHRVLTNGSHVLDHGRGVRLVTDAQRTVLTARDRGCRHPDCDRPAGWCEAHHVVPWQLGGPSDLSNLVLACSRHHHLWHHPGWEVTLDADAVLSVTDPDGTTRTSRPPGFDRPSLPGVDGPTDHRNRLRRRRAALRPAAVEQLDHELERLARVRVRELLAWRARCRAAEQPVTPDAAAPPATRVAPADHLPPGPGAPPGTG